MEIKLTICLVTYSQKFDKTLSFKCLSEMSSSIRRKINLLVFDNGPVDYTLESDFDGQYIYNKKEERGTRIAYQAALEITHDSWLMLLDDDTRISERYFKNLFIQLDNHAATDIVAYCPIIEDETGQISPTKSNNINMLNFPRESGIFFEDITGIASGLTLSKEFMQSIGGFNLEFPLDYLDHWIFYSIIANGKKVKVLENRIQHTLSVQNLESLSAFRFYSIFKSEYIFYKQYRKQLLFEVKKKYIKMIIKGVINKNSGIRWQILFKILRGK